MKEIKQAGSDIKQLVEFLRNTSSYPHNPERVQHVQTHISNVFIAPPYVFKTKKRVDFGFLDYSTLEKRHYYCRQEVELNRRLCSDIYLGVEAIVSDGDSFRLIPERDLSESDSVVDFAVKMKLLDETWFLHSYIDRGDLTTGHLNRVAGKLADFYLGQSPDETVKTYGEIEKITYNTDENFGQTEQFIDDTISEEAYDAIKYFTNTHITRNGNLFQKRISENKIVDGHGDLHLEHIHISPEGVCIYDCIEFSERLRCGDQAADLAFLAMDLDFNGCWDESGYFIDQMAERLNDPDLEMIIDFYKCYRAYVKGKVKSMKSREEEVDESDRVEAHHIAKIYFNLALRYALVGSRPTVLICMGRIGTGKSTIARHLGEVLNVEVYSSDNIRKEMAGLPLEERPSKEVREKIYSAGMSAKTYAALTYKAKEAIGNGKSVVLDATYSMADGRRQLIHELEKAGASYFFIEANASDEVIKSRLKKREEGGTVSDARLEDFEMLTERYEPSNEIESNKKISVQTEKQFSDTAKELYQKLIEVQIEKQNSG